jgi:DNA invertase Pin-like site-specific DNA recombinase
MDAIYARQSIEKKDSISIESQIQFSLKEIPDEDYRVYFDKGYSGSNINRPDFERLLRDIKLGRIRRVVVYRLDRISRSLLDFANIIALFKEYQVEFISVSEKFDTSTPVGRAMLSIVMVFAQLERETIQERVRDNYYQRGEKGLYLGGVAPFGYDKVETLFLGKKTYMFEENEDQSTFVRQIYDMYLEDMKSLGEIARNFNSKKMWTNKGNMWTAASIGRLIKNPVYVKSNADVYNYLKNKGATVNNDISDFASENGCYVYGERKSVTTSKFTDLKNNFVTLAPHKGLIDANKWLKCQLRADKNKNLKNSGKGKNSWLSGLMKCGYCGYAVNVVKNPRHTYINCGGRKNGICNGRQKVIYLNDIEDIAEIKLIEKIKSLKNEYTIDMNTNSRQINELKISLVKVEENIKKLVDSLLTLNDISSKYVNEKITELDSRKNDLLGEVNKLSIGNLEQKVSKEDLSEYLINWEGYTLDQKKKVARTMIERINITDDEIEMIFKI